MIFSWLKLGLGLMTLFVCLAIGSIAWIVMTKFSLDLSTSIALGCGAFLLAVVIYYLMMTRLGYSIKLGHLAIIERAYHGENVPSNPVEFSKTIIHERFGGNRQYYTLSRDLVLTIRQIERVILRGFSLDTDIPDLQTGRWFRHFISMPAIRCVDECCLSYALSQKSLEVNAACVDALTYLVQGWPTFMRKALKVSVFHHLMCLLAFAIFFVPGFFICRDLGVNTLPWFGIAFLLMITVKIAFFDSYVLSKIVCEFLALAADQKIDSKNYSKLDKWSKGYAKLRSAAEKATEKAEDEADKAARVAKKEAEKETKALAAENLETIEPEATAQEPACVGTPSVVRSDDGKEKTVEKV